MFEVCLNPTAVQNEDVCVKTATFCRFMIPGLFPWSLVTILIKVCPVHTFDLAMSIIFASHPAHGHVLEALAIVDLQSAQRCVLLCSLNNKILVMLHPTSGSFF